MIFSKFYIHLILFITLLFLNCKEKMIDPLDQGVFYYCSRPIPSGAWQVYKKDLATGTIDTITKNTAYNYWWVERSPDKTQLLLLRSPYSSTKDQFDYVNCEMIRSNANGTNEQVIVTDNEYGWYAFGNPHWHPDGTKILMLAQPSNAANPFYIFTIDPTGNNPQQLSTQWSIDANWSPNGNKIVFIGIGATGQVPDNFEVFTAGYNRSSNQLENIKQLTADATRNHDPCFSPDGKKIAFSASNATLTNADIVTIDTTGANRATLLDDNGIHGGPLNWGTDGKIYHHSIYLGVTGFTIRAFNTTNNSAETLLASPAYGYISPFYATK